MNELHEAVGLDAGTSNLSAVRLKKKKDKLLVVNAGRIETLDPLDDPQFHLTFKEFRREKGFRAKHIVAGLSGRSVMVRYMKVPVVPDWKLDMMMDFEIKEQTSTFSKDSYTDFRKIAIPGMPKYDVMMVGISTKSYVDFLLDNIPGIEHFNLNSLGLFSASLLDSSIPEEETSLLIDIGATNTDIALTKNRVLLFARNIEFGTNNFDKDLVAALNVDISEAARLRTQKGIITGGDPDRISGEQKDLNRALLSSCRMFSTHISSALQYCREQIKYYDIRIEHVFTTGGGSLTEGINDFLEQEMNANVKHLDISDGLDLSRLSEERRDQFEEDIHSFSTAVGLAASVLHQDGTVLDPMPARVRKKRRFLRRHVYLAAGAVLFFLMLVLWGGDIVAEYKNTGRLIEKRQTLLENIKEKKTLIRNKEAVYSVYNDMEKALRKRVYSATDMLKLFNILQNSLPEDMWITSFSTEDIGTITNGSDDEKGQGQTIQNRGTVYIAGQIRTREGKSDPHQILDDYIKRLQNRYREFKEFIPLKKEYSDTTSKDKFFYKYKILLSDTTGGRVQ